MRFFSQSLMSFYSVSHTQKGQLYFANQENSAKFYFEHFQFHRGNKFLEVVNYCQVTGKWTCFMQEHQKV